LNLIIMVCNKTETEQLHKKREAVKYRTWDLINRDHSLWKSRSGRND